MQYSRVSFGMTLNDLAKYSVHRAVSLRQLSFLLEQYVHGFLLILKHRAESVNIY